MPPTVPIVLPRTSSNVSRPWSCPGNVCERGSALLHSFWPPETMEPAESPVAFGKGKVFFDVFSSHAVRGKCIRLSAIQSLHVAGESTWRHRKLNACWQCGDGINGHASERWIATCMLRFEIFFLYSTACEVLEMFYPKSFCRYPSCAWPRQLCHLLFRYSGSNMIPRTPTVQAFSCGGRKAVGRFQGWKR